MDEVVQVPCEVSCFQDGNLVCCMIGDNLQEGVAGFGDTVSEALKDLANNIES